MKGFTTPAEIDAVDLVHDDQATGGPVFRGHLLDLRQLAFALTDESNSLASACRAFDVEHGKQETERHGVVDEAYVDYNRADVRATAELYVALMREYVLHPIGLQPTKAYSPASIGKAYLRQMGVAPRLTVQTDFPREVLGWAMSAYFGGRAECRIRGVPVPVVYLDFLSMYPTVNALMGLWSFHIAERIEVEEAVDEVRDLLEWVTLEDCFDPALWPRLQGFALLHPDGDVVPVRARYDDARDSYQIGVNPLKGEPRWYALADLVAAKLLTGQTPTVLRAVVLRPSGVMLGLKPIRLRGGIGVDPAADDLFRVVVEERQRTAGRPDLPEEERERIRRFLKVFANATAYGIFAEINRQEGRDGLVRVYGPDGSFVTRVSGLEVPGDHAFPPIPAWIAAGARLMLAMLEASVDEYGGTYACCDTDSMAVMATETGGPIESVEGRRALSWAEVDEIRERFARVNPYDRTVVPGSVLKLEKENVGPDGGRQQLWCLAISAKRYALFVR